MESKNHNIQLSKDGINLPYTKFIGDSSIGFIFIVFGLLCIYFPAFFMPSFQQFDFAGLPKEVSIYISVLLFFLSLAIGGALNAASWFFVLGTGQIYFSKVLFRNIIIKKKLNWFLSIFLGGSYNSMPVKESVDFFDLKETDFSLLFRLSKNLYYEQDSSLNFHPIIGQRVFFRSLAFIFLIAAIFCIGFRLHFFIYTSLAFFSFLLTLSEDFYLSCKVISSAYLYSNSHYDSTDFKDKPALVKMQLIEKILLKNKTESIQKP